MQQTPVPSGPDDFPQADVVSLDAVRERVASSKLDVLRAEVERVIAQLRVAEATSETRAREHVSAAAGRSSDVYVYRLGFFLATVEIAAERLARALEATK